MVLWCNSVFFLFSIFLVRREQSQSTYKYHSKVSLVNSFSCVNVKIKRYQDEFELRIHNTNFQKTISTRKNAYIKEFWNTVLLHSVTFYFWEYITALKYWGMMIRNLLHAKSYIILKVSCRVSEGEMKDLFIFFIFFFFLLNEAFLDCKGFTNSVLN